ncbi:mycofactocin biosynthesis glycosyltransferase MftF [Pseudonocardia humida]|uniref:Mycofactocin biosynthesis glycosyltransferase MftF n=1 Tax=Pseudonocardia humida TaxID=2800819 RepID=A0ABT1A1F1_9PSEU|nr:mycofactocin biosynthesis glycosyltransferase MftF [Pseudonocardia humida]MCO1656836.1 mycofactocin biosynthesis glycosyltransferase MftF [Pseudonocardia humida]
MSAGPGEVRVPRGVTVRLDRQALRLDDGAVLVGGAPPRMMHLAPAAAELVRADGTATVDGPTSAALVRTLLDAGIAHPVEVPAGAAPTADEVTVVVPVRDRVDGLRRLLAGLPGLRTVVVDDGSTDAGAIAAVAGEAGARVLRHERSRGPAAARNTGLAAAGTALVAFLDSDVVPEPGWLDPLLAAFADPAVGLAAPRIVALAPVRGWLGRYEALRSSLDLGRDPALVVPRSRVAYVPSAAVVVRRAAAGAGFDDRMHVAEDVDLVLRLHAAGWRLRYEPAARVGHDHRTRPVQWWLRKAYYGTGAAPLALRHRGSVPPMVLSPSGAAIAGLVVLARPWSLLGAAVVAVGSTERLARRLGRLREPRRTAARLVGLGALGTIAQTADAVTRHYWPVSVVAALLSRRVRRRVLAIALVEGVVDWWRHRDPEGRAGLDPARFVLARRLDDLGYGAGLWWGAWRHRTVQPLRPVGAGASGRSERPARPGADQSPMDSTRPQG